MIRTKLREQLHALVGVKMADAAPEELRKPGK